MNQYLEKALARREDIIQDRRAFHRFAEVAFDLPQTTAYVMEKLKEYGLKPHKVGKAGISCTVGQEGKVILLRADMDALTMTEQTGLPFAATNGNCHSCGHDAHTAMLLAAARLLRENEANLNGTVKFMFQPAEEKLAGAIDMIEAGIMENPKVDAAFAMHVLTGKEEAAAGTVSYAKGPALYSADAIRITITGQNAHGSTPEKGVDAVSIAAHIVIALQEILAREVACTDHVVVIVGKITGGDTVNTVGGHAVLEASARATTQEQRDFLKKRIKEISEGVAATFRGKADVQFEYGIGPLYNDPKLTEKIAGYCAEIVGPEKMTEVPASTGAEDFTSVAALVPTTMVWLGAGNSKEGYSYGGHNPKMTINEDVLPVGAALYAHVATEYLKSNG